MATNTWIGNGSAGNPHMLWEEQPAFSLRDVVEIAQQQAAHRYLLKLSAQPVRMESEAQASFDAFLVSDVTGKQTRYL